MFRRFLNSRESDYNQINQRIDSLVRDYEDHIIKRINEEYKKTTGWADRLADKIASFGGSWKFIMVFFAFLMVWMVWNILSVTKHFDEPPYILLNLILSFTAAFQAPIIMMSQNRHAEKDKHEAVIDFAINYKAEQEVDDLQKHLNRLEKDISEIKSLLRRLETNLEK